MRVFVHWKEEREGSWIQREIQFAQVPAVGEYIVLDTRSEYYEVHAVVHVPTDAHINADFDAEIWVGIADHHKVIRAASDKSVANLSK